MRTRRLARLILWLMILAPEIEARTTHLIIDDALLKRIERAIPAEFRVVAKSPLIPRD